MQNKEFDPPKISTNLIKRLCKKHLVEEIEGNLIEFYSILKGHDRSFLLVRYWYEVLNYLRPSFLKSIKPKTIEYMFTFNPKIAIRNLLKHRVSTVISLVGFIIGITSVIFLYFYIENELNYDAFHQDKEKIYRVYRTSQDASGEFYDIGVCSGPYTVALNNDFPDKIQSTLRLTIYDLMVSFGEKSFYEDRVMLADTNFFEFFSYPLKIGDPKTVLDGLYNVVISEKLAIKYFGNENPIGKSIALNGEGNYEITGVFSEPENKTHLRFDMVLSMSRFEGSDWIQNWWRNSMFTYIKIDPEDASYLQSQFPDFMEKYLGDDFQRANNKNGLHIVPLSDIHFHNSRYDPIPKTSMSTIIIIISVAISILFIACFNYINLTIANSHKRAKEVGIRKVLGVERSRLALQFLGESVLILCFSIGVAIVMSTSLREVFNTYFGLEVIYNWQDVKVRYIFAALIAVLVISSGLYPAILLSSFEPLKILKTNKLFLGKNILVRKGLIISQFFLSIFLIITTMLIYVQLQYISQKDLGYNANSVLVIDTNHEIREKYNTFRERLLEDLQVKQVTVGSGVPGGFHDNLGIQFSNESDPLRVHTVFADPHYTETFDIPVIAGRAFSDEFITDKDQAMMINETAWKATGLPKEEIVGKKVRIPFREWDRTVIGIFRDYHFQSLKDKMVPLAIIMGSDMRRIAIKIENNNRQATLKRIEQLYDELSPNFSMNSWLLEDDLKQQYKPEEEQAKVFTVFSGISIILACIGILGLAAFSAQQKQKEIGIRKVLGASIPQVLLLISKEYLFLIVLAVFLAIPASWYFMSRWLMDFAYRIQIEDHWITFLAGGFLTALIALLTIGLKTYKTASSNPVETIRYE